MNDIDGQTARYFARAIRGFKLTEAELASIFCQFYCATTGMTLLPYATP